MRRLQLLVLLLTGLLLVTPSAVYAASKPANGLRLTPLRSYPSQRPGQSVNGSLTLTNNTDKAQNIAMLANTFKVTNSNYDYRFDADEIAKWVHFYDNAFELLPKQSKVVNYSLEVPSNAAAGGYYFALLASNEPTANQKGILEVKRVASLVYLEVDGKLTKKGGLVDMTVPWIAFGKLVPLEINLSNTGNTHIRSRVAITTWRQPGHQQINQSLAESFLLPGTVRKVDSQLILPTLPGIYRVHLEYAPPQGGIQTLEKDLLYLPLWSLAVGLVVLIGLAAELSWQLGKRKPPTNQK